MKITDAMREAAPAPLYSCKNTYCAAVCSYHAEMLAWWNGGFYCEHCIEDGVIGPDDTEASEAVCLARHNGPTLADVLKPPAKPLRYLAEWQEVHR